MRPWGNAEHKKLNMALLLLLVAALLALAGVLFVRTKPDAVSPDNHIETTQKLSMTMSLAGRRGVSARCAGGYGHGRDAAR